MNPAALIGMSALALGIFLLASPKKASAAEPEPGPGPGPGPKPRPDPDPDPPATEDCDQLLESYHAAHDSAATAIDRYLTNLITAQDACAIMRKLDQATAALNNANCEPDRDPIDDKDVCTFKADCADLQTNLLRAGSEYSAAMTQGVDVGCPKMPAYMAALKAARDAGCDARGWADPDPTWCQGPASDCERLERELLLAGSAYSSAMTQGVDVGCPKMPAYMAALKAARDAGCSSKGWGDPDPTWCTPSVSGARYPLRFWG
jgi:hypothetical protein